MTSHRFIFFGTPEIARQTLEHLCAHGLSPALVVSAPDRPRGRGLSMSPTPVKAFALDRGLEVLTPEKITQEFSEHLITRGPWDFFVVAAYGKILPEHLLSIPSHGTINLHPSLLPRYRGPAPLEAVLRSDDRETGVSIMLIDREVDHGPLIATRAFPLPPEEMIESLTKTSARVGADLIVEHIHSYLAGNLVPTPQDHSHATFTKKIAKEDGVVSLEDDPWTLWKTFRALHLRPGVYFLASRHGKELRVKIKEARWDNGTFVIDTVIPENGNPVPFSVFQSQNH